jgi:hypothetical protein
MSLHSRKLTLINIFIVFVLFWSPVIDYGSSSMNLHILSFLSYQFYFAFWENIFSFPTLLIKIYISVTIL